jgi:16S rRNA (adenine1518-N6/adenine1519-N6)-dimethyltransferase
MDRISKSKTGDTQEPDFFMPGHRVPCQKPAKGITFPPMTSPKVLLTAWNLRAKKSLGQNFLSNPAIAEAIVARAGLAADDMVIEIGPGLGALTVPIAKRARRVIAVETDAQMIELLRPELKLHQVANVEVLHADFLTVDIADLAPAESRRLVVMGNLPYNISSQVLVRLIQSRERVSRAILMFQKELCRRITAPPGGRDYGRLTAMLAYCAEAAKLLDVAASGFFPRPKVDSEVLEIRFEKIPRCPAEDEAFLFRTIKAAFGQRRKTLKNALAGSELRVDPAAATAALSQAGIDPSRRAETLDVEEFVRLSDALGRLIPMVSAR